MSKAKKVVLVLCGIAFLAGLVLFLYPDYLRHQFRQACDEHLTAFNEIFEMAGGKPVRDDSHPPGPYDALYWDMEAYNQELYESGQSLLIDEYAYEQPAFLLSDYGIDNDEVLAFIEIPSISVTLPVFNGASRSNMIKGAVYLVNTSLPIGGENTNCVIAAHNQWKGVHMFMKIPDLQPGDPIYVRNFWETLEYRVKLVKIIEPDAIGEIMIREGQQALTLTTCYYTTSGKKRCMVVAEPLS